MSNIAWDPRDDAEVAEILRSEGATAVEIAPTKLWSDPTSVTRSQVEGVRRFWAGRELPVVALQALLFGHGDLRLFGDADGREALAGHLDKLFELAQRLGARVLVLGSPSNRRRLDLPSEQAEAIARDFFLRVGLQAEDRDVVLCIEPNPVQYGADFVTHAAEGLRLVRAVGRRGFGLHLDTACMSLAGDDIGRSVLAAGPTLCHFHASEPELAPVGGPNIAGHEAAATALRGIAYEGFVSVEMRPATDSPPLDTIRVAVSFAARCYGDPH